MGQGKILEDGEVIFSIGASHLALTRIGDAPAGYPSTSYRTRISISSGPFSATVEAYGTNYAFFLRALRELDKTLSGEAKLTFWNEAHSITLSGGGKGDVELVVKITDGLPAGAILTVPIHFDQSYLPEIIRAIELQFPE